MSREKQLEQALRGLIRVATGSIEHDRAGQCPDAVEGHDARAADCAACKAVMRAERLLSEPAQAEQSELEAYSEWRNSMEPYGFNGSDAFAAGAAWQRTVSAQTEQQPITVPEGWALVPARMELKPEDVAIINFHCGLDEDATEADERYTGGVLWVGETVDDDGTRAYGLNIASIECLEEGSTPIVEFAAPIAPAPQHPDDAAVDRFAAAMKAKLAAARAKGRGGWDDPNACTDELLAELLVGHLGKGNAGTFEDVANFAMMLRQRGADPQVLADAAKAAPQQSGMVEALREVLSAPDLERAQAIANSALGRHWAGPQEQSGLVEALEFYARREHFVLANEDAWDTVSGEPLNILHHDDGFGESEGCIEDGSVARSALEAYRATLPQGGREHE